MLINSPVLLTVSSGIAWSNAYYSCHDSAEKTLRDSLVELIAIVVMFELRETWLILWRASHRISVSKRTDPFIILYACRADCDLAVIPQTKMVESSLQNLRSCTWSISELKIKLQTHYLVSYRAIKSLELPFWSISCWTRHIVEPIKSKPLLLNLGFKI